MLRKSGTDEEGRNWFDFVVDHFQPAVRINWAGDGAMVAPHLLPILFANRYARNLTDEEGANAETGAESDDGQTKPDLTEEEQKKIEAKAKADAEAETQVLPAQPALPEGSSDPRVQAVLEQIEAQKQVAGKPASGKK